MAEEEGVLEPSARATVGKPIDTESATDMARARRVMNVFFVIIGIGVKENHQG